MTTSSTPAGDGRSAVVWSELRPGDQVEALQEGIVLHRGSVEETLPHLGVVWIREVGTGARKILSAGDDIDLRRC
ncbi:hypothetical protein ACH9EU_00375 [Kocuria sp. M1R5S2]|uniref:hypothetical protein n=1 Tax=Kocuria rhizosphaerae TaxID=3376285 RepID=UPI00378CA635